MEKVERKPRAGRGPGRGRLLCLCCLLLAGCLAAFFLLRKEAEQEPMPSSRERRAGAISSRSVEELERLSVIPREGQPWSVVRSPEGALMLLSEEGQERGMVDETVGNMLQDAAVNLTYEDIFTETRADWADHAADFGLDKPLLTAEIRFTDGTEVTARVGDSADPEDGSVYYMTVEGDDRLYALASGTVQDLSVEPQVLLSVPRLQIQAALLNRIRVISPGGDLLLQWELQGKVNDRDAAVNWIISAPIHYPADYERMKNLRETAEGLRLGAYVGEATKDMLKKCGLEAPTRLEFCLSAGSTGTVSETGVYDVEDWEERTMTLELGAAKSEMVDYVRFGDAIYTMSHFSLSAFTEVEPLSTAARYLVATPLTSLESMTLEQDGKTTTYALIWLSASEEGNPAAQPREGESGEDNVRCLKDGEELSYTAFSAAWERLMTVTISGRLPEGYLPKAAHTKYVFHTVSGGTHTLALSDYDGVHDAVTLDGCTLFYLIKGGVTALP